MSRAQTAAGLGLHMWQQPAMPFTILLAAFWLRLWRLDGLPIYWDEAFHIYYARAPFLTQQFFSVFPFARWLNVMLIAALQPMGLESLWVARLLSVLLSLVTAACTYWVGNWLGGKQVGRLALLVYLVLPFAFFYDRQAMADPIMAAFGALGVVFGLRTIQTLAWRDAIVAGACIGLATLTKFAGVLYLPVLFVAAMLLPVTNRKKAWALAAVHAAVALALFGAVFLLAQRENGSGTNPMGAGNWCHSPLCQGTLDAGKLLQLPLTNVGYYLDTIPSFYTPVVWLLAVGVVVLVKGTLRGKVGVLAILAFALALPYILIADLFPPRYLMFTLLPVAVLAAYGLEQVAVWVTARWHQWEPIGRGATAALLFIPCVVLDGFQIATPLTAPMPTWEHNQYAAGWPGSIAAEEIARALPAVALPGQRINVLAGGMYLEFYAFWGERLGIVKPTRDVTEATYIPWLTGTDKVCLIDLTPTLPLGETPFGMLTETLASYDVPGSGDHPEIFHGAATANLRCVTGTTPDLSHKIDDYVFGDPASAADFYPAIADGLRGFTGPVFLYPGNQQAVLAQQPGMRADLRPLADSWPQSVAAVAAQVKEAAATTDEIRVVAVFTDRGDPKQMVDRWLAGNLFPVDTQISGPVHLMRFLPAKSEAAPIAVNGGPTLAGLGSLSQAEILDPVVPANRLVRVSVTWLPDETPATSYKVFAHVFDQQGQLVAQHDGLPQNGYTETNTWAKGQPVTDRFVIYFPPEVGAGNYTVKTGFYDPAGGQRLMTADGLDSLELGTVTVP